MQEYEIQLPDGLSGNAVIGSFESRCESLGLIVKRLPLKKFPGCIHWHLTRPGEKGTLEATWWRGKLWLSVHENRRADWHKAAILKLQSV